MEEGIVFDKRAFSPTIIKHRIRGLLFGVCPIRTVGSEPTQIQQFRSAPWPFQKTFKTPLKQLSKFVSVFLSTFTLRSGALSTEQVVFEPKHVLQLLTKYSVRIDNCYDMALEVDGGQLSELLEAILSDWIDFVFVGTPDEIAIYADHDEYTTFYVHNQATLDNLVKRLAVAGFEPVPNHDR